MIKHTFFVLLFCFLASSCYRVPDRLSPQISSKNEEAHIKDLKPAFANLSIEDEDTAWGKEYYIALAFAKQLDLYRAITTFKRALILIPLKEEIRALEIQYNILLCYYLGKKHQDAIDYFEQSDLDHVDRSFQVFHDLLVILYASYQKIGRSEKAETILELFEKNFSNHAKKLQLSSALLSANIHDAKTFSKNTKYEKDVAKIAKLYQMQKKSIPRAQILNALLPGSGYLYVGQKKAALTSFLMNGLFTAAAVHFFRNRQIAAGIITSSFEAGWYFGGIHGAGLEAKFYNEKIYERVEEPLMDHHKLFPTFMIQYGF